MLPLTALEGRWKPVETLFELLELGVFGTVVLLEEPPLKPDDVLELVDGAVLLVLGTVVLLEAPPLNPEDELVLDGADDGAAEGAVVFPLIVDLLLAPPEKPLLELELLDEFVLVDGLDFVVLLELVLVEGLVFVLEFEFDENDPVLDDVLGELPPDDGAANATAVLAINATVIVNANNFLFIYFSQSSPTSML
ncbi:hypothetical protein ACFQZT_24470 [Paenibacillus sp. GCM10027628]|uniref:hypothetical protein n=1 Tax=Paenibacillus sp. GCM10027628 TaxID=3273413 RepID=UPI003630F472